MGLAAVSLGSVLGHTEYAAMRNLLSAAKPSVGPLDAVCCHILEKDLRVNTDILQLNAISTNGTLYLTHTGVVSMIKEGIIKQGLFTTEDDDVIKYQYESLVAETKVDKEALNKELFFKKGLRDYLLRRQLVGFYLLQHLPDGDRRLPVEVCGRLATLLFGGAVTEEEDAAILAWVEEHGSKKWSGLADSLNRCYPSAGVVLAKRYKLLKLQRSGHQKGRWQSAEVTKIIENVLEQNPRVLEKISPDEVDWYQIATQVNRSYTSVYKFYLDSVHPTLRRYKAGTLEHDVRADLIQAVKERGWQHTVEIDFALLAGQPEFSGHTSGSLYRLYSLMQAHFTKRHTTVDCKVVTVGQVEEWWKSSSRRTKSRSKREKELDIVTAYHQILQQQKSKT
jgi:hypothetical protein